MKNLIALLLLHLTPICSIAVENTRGIAVQLIRSTAVVPNHQSWVLQFVKVNEDNMEVMLEIVTPGKPSDIKRFTIPFEESDAIYAAVDEIYKKLPPLDQFAERKPTDRVRTVQIGDQRMNLQIDLYQVNEEQEKAFGKIDDLVKKYMK